MAEHAQLKSLAERKRLLQAQCDICRKSLQLQFITFQSDSAWLHRGIGSLSRYRSVLWLAAPVAGFLVARRAKTLRWLVIKGFALWQLSSRIWRWTRPFRRARVR